MTVEAINDPYRGLEASLREQLGLDETWVLRDIPWMEQKYFQQLTDAIGEDNYYFVSGSTMKGDATVRVRGSLMINQEGLTGIRKLAERIQT
jgi:hypothetical protein